MNRISVKARIYLSAIVLVVLLFINGLMVWLGHASLNESVSKMQQTDAASTAVLALDRDVQELRFRVDRFIGSGHDSLVQDVEKILERLDRRIIQARESHPGAEMEEQYERIQVHVDEYGKHFAEVVKERQLEKDLVQNDLPSAGDAVDQAIDALAATIDEDDRERKLAVSLASSHFSKAEKLILRYFETPDSQLVEMALGSLTTSRDKLDEINVTSGAKTDLSAKIIDFERISIRAVQATRSYLLLRNVVMAAEASEISYYARNLREAAETRQSEIAAEFEATSQRVNLTTIVSALIAGALSLLTAGRLAMSVLPPITALTQTFGLLSSGQTLSEIPGTERKDEIGQMAQAARVFSNQNLRTKELLHESEHLNATLRTQTRELELINDELDSFAYVASHDLKSPLRGIRQLATWIEEDSVQDLSPTTSDYLDKLIQRVTKMENLLSDLLDFSRVGRINPPSEHVDVNEMLAGVAEISDNPKGVAVRWQDDLPTLFTSRPPLEQVFLNLIGNAIKHNHRGSQGEVMISGTEEGDFYRFCVADNGPGIDPIQHDRAFQMYQRVGDPNVDGSGMGLAIVKKQIEYFGGNIELDSDTGQGARFSFTWPLVSQSQAKEVSSV